MTSDIAIYESDYPNPFLPEIGLFDYLFPSAQGISLHNPASLSDDSVAFIEGHNGRQLKRGELRDRALGLKTGLNAMGVGRGNVGCLWGLNGLEWIIAAYGLLAAGVTVTPANASYDVHEIAHQVNDSGANVVFVSPENLPQLVKAREQFKSPMPDSRIIILDTKGKDGFKSLYDHVGAPSEAEHFDGLESRATAVLCYSSGTTGLPKGVMTTHYNLTSQILASQPLYPKFDLPQDSMLGFLPMSHIYGWIALLIQPLTIGLRTIILPRFDEIQFLSCVQKYRCTHSLFVPPIVLLLVHSQNVPRYDLSSLRIVSCGAAPLSGDLIDAFKKRFPQCTISQSYGMTETSPGIFLAPTEDAAAGHLGIGRLCPTYQARLVRSDGTDAPVGERGELWVRGPCVMKGYHRNEAATRGTMEPGGWLRTGDVLVRGEDGLWAVVDRVKELIKYKGFQVAPAELEGILLQHPAVIDAGVVGVQDDSQATELPRAYIVTTSKEDPATVAKDVQAWVAARVAHHKALRGGVLVIDAIPKSPSGKILRNILRARAKEEFKPAGKL
ncbi:AMP binding protein [Trichosporon asahii var. asahii CBS 2479]|uniref:AMP binding protein n=1 Tax=Trichosporon asahii var. asahii (strain ATCC 90039 / CBS 2479 / JCM 2466 / KCTC 7840 / NBRC 103889/ NCYC 2677 / UAMH 7654) TaxID=1186058 RepID=J6F5G5_TRIAS|nr:AMP binding protein [Trichosporon asahii var. asahii CBS 2479]EJT52279.1 AMP binding protein [Trichosporon asahii var. asahii CBS 2479]